jgi:hypothetical protein
MRGVAARVRRAAGERLRDAERAGDMKSVWDLAMRGELKLRLSALSENQTPQWGKMSAARMVVHIADSFRSSIGELYVKPKWSPLQYSPLRDWVIYRLPFPKNVPTAPELVARVPGEYAAEVALLESLIDRFATRHREGAWPVHAAFGRLSGDDWGVLMYRHTDHHFRQFGI